VARDAALDHAATQQRGPHVGPQVGDRSAAGGVEDGCPHWVAARTS